ncbi:MAG: caspase family protein [Planctomycetota bacterium]|nr:caspase family protein [Planctomycetota bacterium]
MKRIAFLVLALAWQGCTIAKVNETQAHKTYNHDTKTKLKIAVEPAFELPESDAFSAALADLINSKGVGVATGYKKPLKAGQRDDFDLVLTHNVYVGYENKPGKNFFTAFPGLLIAAPYIWGYDYDMLLRTKVKMSLGGRVPIVFLEAKDERIYDVDYINPVQGGITGLVGGLGFFGLIATWKPELKTDFIEQIKARWAEIALTKLLDELDGAPLARRQKKPPKRAMVSRTPARPAPRRTPVTPAPSTNVPPVIVLASPRNGQRVNEASIAMQGVIEDPDGYIKSVQIYRNDSLIDTLLINGKVPSNTRGIGGVVQKKEAPRNPGFLQRFEVNRDISLRAGSNLIMIKVMDNKGRVTKKEFEIQRSTAQGNVYALVVGINQYQDKGIIPLNFAENDAVAFADFLKKDKNSPIRNAENVMLLTGKKATGREIRKAIYKHLVRKAVQKEDTIIFYFAGHGYSESNSCYLAGYDTEPTALKATALSQENLQGCWKDINAERKLLLVDACHSGGLQGVRSGNSVSELSMGGKGSIMIAASRAKQQSCESPKLKHGIFTHSLIEGWKGGADSSKDGRITARELIRYLETQVPAQAKRLGKEQNPKHEILGAEGELFLNR